MRKYIDDPNNPGEGNLQLLPAPSHQKAIRHMMFGMCNDYARNGKQIAAKDLQKHIDRVDQLLESQQWEQAILQLGVFMNSLQEAPINRGY